MPKTRLFAYNTGSLISGTTQVGDIAISLSPLLNYSQGAGGVRWWNGPDENLGYVITHTTPSGTQPNPDDEPAYIGFYRTNGFDDNEFIGFANLLLNTNYNNVLDASSGLTYNGYWNSYTVNGGNGLTPETAGDNALQIKTDFPLSEDGLYWIKNNNISGGTPFQIYADMTTDGGGWTLLLTNQNTNGWTYSNAILLNQFNPVSGGSNYSIVTYADYLKSSGATFQYMIDANQRNQFGGIWSAPQSYTFLKSDNTQTSITLNTKFGTWNYNDGGIEERMPWYSDCSGYLTTSVECSGGSWWGTLVTGGGWSPTPWISGGCGVEGCMESPGILWYWVR
jgi:hypothetical protein